MNSKSKYNGIIMCQFVSVNENSQKDCSLIIDIRQKAKGLENGSAQVKFK